MSIILNGTTGITTPDVSVTAQSTAAITANRLTSDGTIIDLQKDGTTVGSIGTTSGAMHFVNASCGIRVASDPLRVVPSNGSGANLDNSVDLGFSSVRWKDLYLSGGVYVGGTGSANHLDDYEEGTWTPVVADAATGGNTGSASITYAMYTKVGRQVTVTASLTNIVRTGFTAANVFHVRGLPFTSGTQQTSGSVRTDLITYQGGRTMATANVGVDDSWVTFLASGSNLTDTSIDCGDITNTTADIIFTITYFV